MLIFLCLVAARRWTCRDEQSLRPDMDESEEINGPLEGLMGVNVV